MVVLVAWYKTSHADHCWLLMIPQYLLYTDCRHIFIHLLHHWLKTWWTTSDLGSWPARFCISYGNYFFEKGICYMIKNWTFTQYFDLKANFSTDRILPREQVLAFINFFCLPVIFHSAATFVIYDCLRLYITYISNVWQTFVLFF